MGCTASTQTESPQPPPRQWVEPLPVKADPKAAPPATMQRNNNRIQGDIDSVSHRLQDLDVGRDSNKHERIPSPGPPHGLSDSTYDQLLSNIGGDHTRPIHLALQWIAFSVRPIRLEELAEVMSQPRVTRAVALRNPPSYDALLISGLITVSDGSNEVSLIHASLKDYLTSDHITKSSSASYSMWPYHIHATIASTCIQYLLRFNGPEKSTIEDKKKFPLLEYAARYWHVHARQVTQSPANSELRERICPLALRLFNPASGSCFHNWLRISRPDVSSSTKSDGEDLSSFFYHDHQDDFGSPLYYASACGLADVVSKLIAQGHPARTRAESVAGALYPGPLEVAVEKGFVDVVLLLLQAGARPDTWIEEGGTCLTRAARNGDEAVVRVLLDHGADSNAWMDDGSTALHCAARSGSISLVELLLEYGANVNAKTNVGTTPLHEAVINRNEATAKMLLENGAKVDATTDKSFRTDRGGGLFDLMTIFMEQNSEASREIQDATKKTALYIATDNNSLPLVKLLLSHKAHVDACTDLGATPLYVATFRGYSDIVNLLLASGADARRRTLSGATMLHAAAESRKPELVELFVRRGVDVDALDDWNDTALIRAVNKDYVPVVQKFAELGANLHKPKESTGVTLLQFAAMRGFNGIAAYLLDQGVDMEARNGQGGTALHQAANHGHVETLKLLLQRGADINAAMSVRNLSTLHMAVMGEEKAIMEQLLTWPKPANTEARDDQGFTPLQYTVLQGNKELSEILLRHGANPNVQSDDAVTPLLSAIREQRALVPLLIQYGADPTSKHASGGTMLSLAVYLDDSGLLEQLMQNIKSLEPLFDALLENGMNGRAIKLDDASMLTWAIVNGKEVVIWMMLRYGTVKVNDPLPPLTYPMLPVATQWGHHGIVKLLLRMGADVNGCDKAGLKSIHIAAAKGHADIAKTLVESGCDIDDVGDGRGTPLWFALSNRHDAIVRLLCQHGADLAAEEKKLNITVMIGPKQIFYGIRQ